MNRLHFYPNDDDWHKRGRGTWEDFERVSKENWARLRAMFKGKNV